MTGFGQDSVQQFLPAGAVVQVDQVGQSQWKDEWDMRDGWDIRIDPTSIAGDIAVNPQFRPVE
jgi:hypothetical protein